MMRMTVMLLSILMFSLLFSYASPVSQVTRGIEPPQRVLPIQETHRGLEVNWVQLLAMLSVLAGMHAFGMRYIVTPAIISSVEKAMKPVREKIIEMDKTLDKLKQEMDLRVKEAEDAHKQFREALRDLREELFDKK